jgi:pentose-5-phosphate-3-epimerase
MEYLPYITFIVRSFKKLGLFWGQTFLLPGFIWRFQNSLIKLDCMIQSLLEQRWIEVDGGTWSKNMEANEVVGNSVLALACHNVFKSTLCVFYVY